MTSDAAARLDAWQAALAIATAVGDHPDADVALAATGSWGDAVEAVGRPAMTIAQAQVTRMGAAFAAGTVAGLLSRPDFLRDALKRAVAGLPVTARDVGLDVDGVMAGVGQAILVARQHHEG